MYAKCGALVIAKDLFDMHKSRDVLTWTAVMAGFVHKGQPQDALNYFEQMQSEGLSPDAVTFSCILKACGSIGAPEKGEQIHDEIAKQGLLSKNVVLGTALVDMYAKCGALGKARQVLDDENSYRCVISWNALISGYVQQGKSALALDCYERMQQEGLSPNLVTFICVLKACGSIHRLDVGVEVHNEIIKARLLGTDITLGNALLDMYVKCGSLTKARWVLEELPTRNVISWNTLIVGYVLHNKSTEVLNSFEQMQHEGLSPDAVTLTCTLKACGRIGALERGEEIREEIGKQRLLRSNIELGTALVDMYAKCGALAKARAVLQELPVRDDVSWSALITGYAQQGEGEEALQCFEGMLSEGLSPDDLTFSCILKACASIGAVDRGQKVHDEIIKQGLLQNNVVVGNAVVDMYAKCGALAKAREVLEELPVRDVVSWNALIAGYIGQCEDAEALECYEHMQRESLSPDVVTFICTLKACGSIRAAEKGERIHGEIAKKGLLGTNSVLSTALVDMYAKCGATSKAGRVLEELSFQNIPSWNALIAGCAEQGEDELALKYFERMKQEGACPDVVSFTCVLKACGRIGAIDKGESIHDGIAEQVVSSNLTLATALVDMYAKCGALAKARQVLEEVPVRDVVSWNALIAGYGQHCEGARALVCFKQMQREGLFPDSVTFSGVLSACSRSGLLEDAQELFMIMSKRYGMKPDVEHYTCMVDLYGRAGHLDRAVGMIEEMPSSGSEVWSALLGACRQWEDVLVGRWAFHQALVVEKKDSGYYTLMASIYAAAGPQNRSIENQAIKMTTETDAEGLWIKA